MAKTILPDDLWKRLEPLLPKPREKPSCPICGTQAQ